MANQANQQRAFEFTYVDLDKDNKQKRQKAVFRGNDQKQAQNSFDAWAYVQKGLTGKRYKAIVVDEVLPTAYPLDLAALKTTVNAKRLKAA